MPEDNSPHNPIDFDDLSLGLEQGCMSHMLEGGRSTLLLRLSYPDGTKVWYGIILDIGKEHEFQHCLEQKKTITFADFGQVIASGYGEPSEEQLATLKSHYAITE